MIDRRMMALHLLIDGLLGKSDMDEGQLSWCRRNGPESGCRNDFLWMYG